MDVLLWNRVWSGNCFCWPCHPMFVSYAGKWWLSAFLDATEISQPVNYNAIGCVVRERNKQITRFSKSLEPERKLASVLSLEIERPPALLSLLWVLVTNSHLTPLSMVVRAPLPHVSIPGAPQPHHKLIFIVCGSNAAEEPTAPPWRPRV